MGSPTSRRILLVSPTAAISRIFSNSSPLLHYGGKGVFSNYGESKEENPTMSKFPNSSFRPFSDFLTDTHGRRHNYLRISLTEKCNLRCNYCMPLEGVGELTTRDELLTSDEIVRLVKVFAELGVDKIRLTGGEPLIRKDIVDLTRTLKQINGIRNIFLTTNGVKLMKFLPQLIDAGLDGVNVSLDTLQPKKFEFISRRPQSTHKKVLDAIENVLMSNIPSKLKINCVVMKGINEDEMVDFIDRFKNLKMVLRFIEYMPFEGNRWSKKKVVSYKEMLNLLHVKYPNLKRMPYEEGANDTSKIWCIPGGEHCDFRIGFITSMTDNFCGTCNRLRLTVDGNLKVCLFDTNKNETPLKPLIRNSLMQNKDLLEVIDAAIKRKKARHAGMDSIQSAKNRPMILIGG